MGPGATVVELLGGLEEDLIRLVLRRTNGPDAQSVIKRFALNPKREYNGQCSA